MSLVEFKKTDAYGEVTEYKGVLKRVCALYEVIDDILKKCCTGYLNIGECTYETKGYKLKAQIPQSLLSRKVSGIYIKSDWISNIKVFLYEDDESRLDAIEECREELRMDMMKVLEKYEKKTGLPIYSIKVCKNSEDTVFDRNFYNGIEHFIISV